MTLDWQLIERAAVASIHAYLQPDSRAAAGRETATISSSRTSAAATVTVATDMILVAFKGSAELMDWINNLRVFTPKRYCGALTHRGFASAHSSIWPEIIKIIEAHSALPVLLTGHSLGGAMAELSALLLQDIAKTRKVHLIAFGKPNVFAKPRAVRLQQLETQLSVVHGSDLVARRPRWLYGPDQGQQMLYLANAGHTILFPSMQAKMGDFSVSQYLAADGRIKDAVGDHYMSTYLTRVKQAMTACVLVAGGGVAKPACQA